MNKTSLIPHNERIQSLDILRGVAVLGILIMNIQSFSMVSAAYINPNAFGDLSGMNKMVWQLSHIFADQKFISIFSMLFGAGIILFIEHVEKKGYLPARFYFRRLFWLFTFGLIHGYLFWHGDVLVAYAACGVLAFLLRKISPWVLLPLGLIIFFVPSFNYWLFGKSMELWPAEATNGLQELWAPGRESIDKEIGMLTGSITDQLKWRIPETFKMQTFIFVIWYGWRIFALMLIGMSFYKLGLLSGNLRKNIYAILILATLPIGLILTFIGINNNFDQAWSMEYAMFFGWQWNYYGSLFVAVGYMAVVLLLSKYIKMKLLANVGRLAFTNYILMTIICTTIFYGHGFGMFGAVDRLWQIEAVLAIWVFILLFSHFWTKRFYFGPLEWLWRFLTYGNKPIFKK